MKYAQEIYSLVGVAIMVMFVITPAYSIILAGLSFFALLGWALIVDLNL